MVGHVGVADGAEIDGIEAAQPLQPVFGHHASVLAVIIRAPGKAFHVQLQPGLARLQGVEDSQARRDDFSADAVAGNGGDPVLSHGAGLLGSVS